MSDAPQKPSINPTTKPKFKVTQSPFSSNLTESAKEAEGEAAAPQPASKPKPAAPKPLGLKPSSLKASDAAPPPAAPAAVPAAPAAEGVKKLYEPIPEVNEEPEVDGVSFEEEKSGPSVGAMVAVGLQGIAAIAAIVFTVLAVMENMPFL